MRNCVCETLIYEEGTEYEAYRKQMRINTAHFFYFIYSDEIKTAALDTDFSIELENKEDCIKYV